MRHLWTPWRLAFIRGEKPTECIFCQKAQGSDDRANFVVYRGQHNFVLLNTFPYTSGHLMIAPYDHTADFVGLAAETSSEMMELAKRSVAALRRAYRTESFNLGLNLGAAAGAGIADHLHLHVVPRWQGDSNFMSVVGDTRLIPEALETTYERLSGLKSDEPAYSAGRRPVRPASC